MGFGSAWQGVVFRRTFPELEDILTKAHELFGSMGRGGPRFVGGNRLQYIWPTGEKLMFRQMSKAADYWKRHGWSTPWVLFDELTTWPTSECWDLTKSINRGVAAPVPCVACGSDGCEMCDGTGMLEMPRRYMGTTNPHGPGHNWVKRRFIDPGPSGTIIRTIQTVHLPDADGEYQETRIESEHVSLHAPFVGSVLEKSDPTYQARMLAKQPKHIVDAWGKGSWDITSGGMFDDLWNRGVHAIPSFEIPKGWTLRRAFDWGSAKPFSYGLWAVCDGTPNAAGWCPPKGTLIRVREFYGTDGRDNRGLQWTADKVGREGVKKEKAWGLHERIKPGPADTSIWDAESDGKSIHARLKAHGLRFVKADKRSRVNGWEQCRTLIEASLAQPMESPGLFVFERENPHFLRTVPTAQRDDDNLDDLDTDTEDHVADEMRYMALAARPVKPKTTTGGLFDGLRESG